MIPNVEKTRLTAVKSILKDDMDEWPEGKDSLKGEGKWKFYWEPESTCSY